MRKVRLFDLNGPETVLRFYLMMAVIVIFGSLNQFNIAAILGFALAISFILGVSFRKTTRKAVARKEPRISPKEKEETFIKAA